LEREKKLRVNKSKISRDLCVGLMGPDPGSELFSQKIPVLLALLATAHRARIEVSPEVVLGDAGTKFLHP